MRTALICLLAGLWLPGAGLGAEICAGTTYGEGVTLAESTPVAAILGPRGRHVGARRFVGVMVTHLIFRLETAGSTPA